MSDYDLAIVGDGVAAHAALIALGQSGQSMRVVVIAPQRGAARPTIGEHLSAGANPILKDLGLWKAFQQTDQLETQSSYSAWGSAMLSERHALEDPRGAGWCLDRPRFEAWLRAEAEQHITADRHPETVTNAVPNKDGMLLKTAKGNTIQSRFVLDASGRRAVVARHFTRRERVDELIAAYNYFEQIDDGILPSRGPLIEARPTGWLYSALLPERRLIVAWFSDRHRAENAPTDGESGSSDASSFNEVVESSHYTLKRIQTAGYALNRPSLKEPALTDASTRLSDEVMGPTWAAIGDAAAAFDPLSSNGLTTALWSGKEAARAVLAYFAGDADKLHRYQEAYRGGMQSFRQQRRQQYGMERRFKTPFWESRQFDTAAATA